MITLSLLKLLENNGHGTIDQSLFWEKLTLDKNGLYISAIGSEQARGARRMQSYEIYSRARTDVAAYQQLQEVREFLSGAYGSVCELPAVPPVTTEGYKNVDIMPPSTISNNGLDSNGRVVFSITGQIYY